MQNLVRITGNIFCNMYADDTVIVTSDKNALMTMKKIYFMFESIKDWCAVNKIENKAYDDRDEHNLCSFEFESSSLL